MSKRQPTANNTNDEDIEESLFAIYLDNLHMWENEKPSVMLAAIKELPPSLQKPSRRAFRRARKLYKTLAITSVRTASGVELIEEVKRRANQNAGFRNLLRRHLQHYFDLVPTTPIGETKPPPLQL